ncbi:MAG: dihydrolipoyl dehydrogenase [Acidimicrobiales bacterium]
MVVGEVAERFDVAVIGAGPGGYTAAIRCAQAGRSVVLIERGSIGGTCLNVGCIPSKVLIHAAELAYRANTSDGTGVAISATIDAEQMRAHRHSVVDGLTSGVSHLLDNAGVVRWQGTAHFARRNRIVVEAGEGSPRHVEFTDAIIATGSRPVELDGLAFDHPLITDSTGALELDHIPADLAIVGAGYIGVELGTAYAKLGSRVTIIEAADRVLPLMDKRQSSLVARRMKELGVTVKTSSLASRLEGEQLVITSGESSEKVAFDLIVVAVGRRPNTEGLGLGVVGAQLTESGHIRVDAARRASDHIYAIGDVTAGPALAHKATAEAAVAAASIAGQPAAFDPAAIPEVVFCDPELVSVGLSAASAAAAGIEVNTFRFPFSAGSRSATLDDRNGFVTLLADTQGTIVGAQMAGAGVSELAGEVAHAIEMASTIDELADTIHPHPTMSEAIMEAALGLAGRPLHVTRG